MGGDRQCLPRDERGVRKRKLFTPAGTHSGDGGIIPLTHMAKEPAPKPLYG